MMLHFLFRNSCFGCMLLVFMCLHTSTNQYFAKVHAFAYIRILCKSWHSNRYCNWRGCLCAKTGLIFNVSVCIAKSGSRSWLCGLAPHSQSRKPHGLGLVARQQQLPALAAAGWCRWVRPAAPCRSRCPAPAAEAVPEHHAATSRTRSWPNS